MPITASNLTAGSNNVAASSFNTASVSPTGNRLVLVSVTARMETAAVPVEPTLSGNGLTYVKVNDVLYFTDRRRLTTFRALGASPSAGAITIDFAGSNQTSCVWAVDEFTNVDTSGANGAGAVVQSVVGSDVTGTATAGTVTLGAFGNTNNATFGAFAIAANATSTAGAGFAKLGDTIDATPDQRETSEWRNDNDTSVDMTFSVGGNIGGVAIEIKEMATRTSGLFSKYW